MSELKIYNCLKSGGTSKLRNVKSTYSDNRTLIIQDPINKKLWLLHGTSVDEEIKRLSSFSLDEINSNLGGNYTVEIIEGANFNNKIDFFLNFEKSGKKEKKKRNYSISSFQKETSYHF